MIATMQTEVKKEHEQLYNMVCELQDDKAALKTEKVNLMLRNNILLAQVEELIMQNEQD